MLENGPAGIKTFCDLMTEEAIATPVAINSLNLPFWISGFVLKAYQLQLREISSEPILFFEIEKTASFERIVALVTVTKRILKNEPIIIADHLNPRFRALFVRERIAFVRGEEDIFAPRFAVKLLHLPVLSQMYPDRIVDELSPFAIKLIAGALTDFLDIKHLKVNEIVELIGRSGRRVPPSKVSVALRELKALDLVSEEGLGPTKYFVMSDKNEAFKKFLRLPHMRPFKRMNLHWNPKEKEALFSGESALARFSNLSDPKKITFAVHKTNNGIYESGLINEKMTKGNPNEVEIWKEDPTIFSIDKSINPVELFLSVKPHLSDPRVFIEMKYVLKKYGIDLTEETKHG